MESEERIGNLIARHARVGFNLWGRWERLCLLVQQVQSLEDLRVEYGELYDEALRATRCETHFFTEALLNAIREAKGGD